MAVRYDKLVPALKRLLDEDRIDVIGRSVAFIRRLRQLSACSFVWAVVLSRFGSGRQRGMGSGWAWGETSSRGYHPRPAGDDAR